MKQLRALCLAGLLGIGRVVLTGLLLWSGCVVQPVPEVVDTVRVEGHPVGVAVNTVTNRIYVANLLSNTVSVIDGASHVLITTIPVSSTPFSVGVNPNTNFIYVGQSGNSRLVTIINGANNTVVTTLPTDPFQELNAVAVNT